MNNVSIIAAVMNRNQRAAGVVPNWLSIPEVKEIILVDWSSTEPLVLPDDPRLKVIRVEGEPHWILTHAYNLAASLASGRLIVKMDIDYVIQPHFIRGLIDKKRHFHRGKTSLARNDNERHLCGFAAYQTEDFWRVGGYNESLSGYGMDDWDLYDRMRKSGCKWHFVSGAMGIEHLPHPASDRSANLAEKDIEMTNDRNKRQALADPWSSARKRIQWIFADGAYRRES